MREAVACILSLAAGVQKEENGSSAAGEGGTLGVGEERRIL